LHQQHVDAAAWAAQRRAASAADWAHRGAAPSPADPEAWHAWHRSAPTGPARTAWLARQDEARRQRGAALFAAHIRSALSTPYSSTHRWGQGGSTPPETEWARSDREWRERDWAHHVRQGGALTPGQVLAAARARRAREIQAMNFMQSMPRGWVGAPTPPRYQGASYLRRARVPPSPSAAFEIRPWRPGDAPPQRTSGITQFTEFRPDGTPTLIQSARWAPGVTRQPWVDPRMSQTAPTVQAAPPGVTRGLVTGAVSSLFRPGATPASAL
jgi:hypothetical protein